ncbi:PAM protein [Geosmithia morbida]|uniref:PAM protein n=1 Tax=Geosmithia morbida TaxID=1094350 RepID=A0A9P4Z3F0_9HYPO|nr:PAM protein [Geosmithia morbida]KAF4126714.1 PAM protein [Geosmithia morbida]
MSLVVQFLTQINQQVRNQQGDALCSWLQVSPESGAQYHQLASELRTQTQYASGSPGGLDDVVDRNLPESDDDDVVSPWSGFRSFIKDYMAFWRDVDYDDLVAAHDLLNTLVNSCATALSHPQGGMMLKTSMSLSETLAGLTMTLSRRPDLLRRAERAAAPGDDSQKSLAEKSAETIQRIFKTCLQDRTTDRYTTPGGTKVAVYKFANLVLKLLFACRRIQLATMLLTQIESQAPLLSLYPASQRVTYLYYLGRYWLSNNHFVRASRCLSAAYAQTPARFVSHRTRMLTYLIPCNMLLGRFPSDRHLLSARPEAATLGPVFGPLCSALRTGDFASYQRLLAERESWLLRRGLLLPLTYKLRPLLWRSLARRVFLLTYEPPLDPSSRKAATLDITHLQAAAEYLQRRMAETAAGKLRPNEGMVWGNQSVSFDHVEMVVTELVQQGLMHGFVAHNQRRFAIIGAKAKGPVIAGWPPVWQAVQERRYDDDFDPSDIPGWVGAP